MKFNAFRRGTAETTQVNTPVESAFQTTAVQTPTIQTPDPGRTPAISGKNTPRNHGSRSQSRRGSFARERSAYNSMPMEELDRLQGNMTLSCLWQEQQKLQYTSSPCEQNEGVIVRTPQCNIYMCQPPSLRDNNDALWSVAQELRLKVRVFLSPPNLLQCLADTCLGLLDNPNQRHQSHPGQKRYGRHHFDGR